MAGVRIHYFVDNDDDLTACGKESSDLDEETLTDDDSEVTCKACSKRIQDYEDEIDADEDVEEEDTEDTEEDMPVAVAAPVVTAPKSIFTLAPASLDKGTTRQANCIWYYRSDKEGETPARIRKVLVPASDFQAQITAYMKPTPYITFQEQSLEKHIKSGRVIDENTVNERYNTMAAPRKAPATPVAAPAMTAMQRAIADAAARKAAAAQPQVPLIRTPNTPPARPAVTAEQAEQKAPLTAQVCKLVAQMSELHKSFDAFKPFTRIQELETEVVKDKEIIAAQQSVIDAMQTKLEDCYAGLLHVLGESSVTAPDLDGIDPGNVPAAPAAPAARPPIPAKGTGKLAEFSDQDCLDMLAMYNDATSMKQIAEMYDIDNTNNKGAKIVWHCIDRAKKL